LSRFAKNIVTLHGGMGAKQRRQRMTTLQQIPDGTERVLIATGRYLGEGFDHARRRQFPRPESVPHKTTIGWNDPAAE
jgi:hypothetical protein